MSSRQRAEFTRSMGKGRGSSARSVKARVRTSGRCPHDHRGRARIDAVDPQLHFRQRTWVFQSSSALVAFGVLDQVLEDAGLS